MHHFTWVLEVAIYDSISMGMQARWDILYENREETIINFARFDYGELFAIIEV